MKLWNCSDRKGNYKIVLTDKGILGTTLTELRELKKYCDMSVDKAGAGSLNRNDTAAATAIVIATADNTGDKKIWIFKSFSRIS